MKQRYVVLEGLDLAGKSVMVSKLKEILGWESVNEPYTGNQHATEVKRMNNANYLPKHYEMMMLIASRIDCFNEVVDKHRLTGLISDRSVVSSMVYQSTDKFHMNDVLELNRVALAKAKHDIFPDKIIFIDIPHALFLERLGKGGRDIDAKDVWLKTPENWSDMRNRYIQALRIMNKHGVEVHVIDYETTPEAVARLIQK